MTESLLTGVPFTPGQAATTAKRILTDSDR
jgi:hypothetical protein